MDGFITITVDAYKTKTTIPSSGQFIAIWKYNGKIWSSVYRWENNSLYLVEHGGDDLIIVNNSEPILNGCAENAVYITLN